jgi:Outer membrane protein beta-barrel domain
VRLRRFSWAVLALAAMVPNRAIAQEHRQVDVAGGYSWMHDYDGKASFPAGWFAAVGGDIAGPVGVAGDASGSYKSLDGLDIKMSVSVHTLMAGPRFVWRARRASPYLHMLFGASRIATTYELLGLGQPLSAAQTNFAMAPGGGVDIPFSDRVGIRAGASLRIIRSETATPTGSRPASFKEFQLVAGLVFR